MSSFASRSQPAPSGSALSRPLQRTVQSVVVTILQWEPAVALFHRALRVLFGLEVLGWEHVPARRPVILISNHASHYDGLFLRSIGREIFGEPLVSVAWGGVRDFPFAQAALSGRAFPVVLTDAVRNNAGTRASVLDEMIASLEAGRCVAINPEGDRYDALAPFQPGAAYAALATGTPILPATLRGVLPLWRTLPWPRRWWGEVTAQLHPAVFPEDYAHLPRREAVREMTAEVRRRVASALDYPDRLAADARDQRSS